MYVLLPVCQVSEVGMAEMMRLLLSAMNTDDLHVFVDCFAPDYESQQPAHPSREFRGRDQVSTN
jgi:hypothetical protein